MSLRRLLGLGPGPAPEPGPGFGKESEAWAAGYLKSLGYEILELGFRIKAGEIDIVARDGDTLVFVEVKARAKAGYGGPEAAVTPAKQRRLAKAAAAYLLRRKGPPAAARFDVLAIVDGKPAHYKDAFSSPLRFTL